MIGLMLRICHFARWIYRPVHGDPTTGKVHRMGPSAVWDLAGRFAADDIARRRNRS